MYVLYYIVIPVCIYIGSYGTYIIIHHRKVNAIRN